MAALTRPTAADAIIHESFEAKTQDHEDHTFSGVMFGTRSRVFPAPEPDTPHLTDLTPPLS